MFQRVQTVRRDNRWTTLVALAVARMKRRAGWAGHATISRSCAWSLPQQRPTPPLEMHFPLTVVYGRATCATSSGECERQRLGTCIWMSSRWHWTAKSTGTPGSGK
eukprot:7894611-Alexandrium_andersonii.AAC.1